MHKSDVFRKMYNFYRFKISLRRVQKQGTLIAEQLGLETDDDVYSFLSKDKILDDFLGSYGHAFPKNANASLRRQRDTEW